MKSFTSQAVDIIVFPEYGLTGTGLDQLPLEEFETYCQTIPEPGSAYEPNLSNPVSDLKSFLLGPKIHTSSALELIIISRWQLENTKVS